MNCRRLRRQAAGLIALAFASLIGISMPAAAAPPKADQPVMFETHVRPLLKAHCFHCHGEANELKGSLDVRLARLILKGGDSGAGIVPGDRSKSYLFEQISSREMPPGDKKLSAADIETIGRWIDAGAKTLKPEPEAIAELTDEDRSFWSFQPIRRPPLPQVKSDVVVRTPVDAFLAAELAKHDLQFSPEADAATLCRRVYFDLIGLPPTPQQIADFVADQSPQKFERLVDVLLVSPHYGERWGRHWLDVAGYADSDGYTPLDPVRPHAFKYRDYVIRSMNDDKPWNEFIMEQLAGDELVGVPVKTPDEANRDKVIATGYLRMGPDGTGDVSVDQPLARNDVLVETIKVVSTSLLGLTVGCAQCHSHRYDPITQSDYYSFRALFEPAYDWKNWRQPQTRLVSTLSPAERKLKKDLEAELTKLSSERSVVLKKMMEDMFQEELKKIPEEFHKTILTARSKMPQRRSMEEADLFKKYPNLDANPTTVQKYYPERYKELAEKYDPPIAAQKAIPRPVEDFIHALTEVPGKVSPTMLFYRGDHNQPRDETPPAELSVLRGANDGPIPADDPKIPTTGRRLSYAKHLTSGRHPLVARVLVNRFWLHHFGRGIVATPGDFGFLGQRPSHPELLDWLADEFVQGGWQLKRMHKLMMYSTAYRQSSLRTKKLDAADPDNLYLGRMSVRRLDAETLRDSVLAVSGMLNLTMYGKSVPVTPDESGQVVLGIDTRDGAGRFTKPVGSVKEEAFRRSVYVQARRTLPLGMLETFDAPEMAPNCACRSTSTVTPQSLLLMNSDFVIQQAEAFAMHLRADAGDDLRAQLELGWRMAFGPSPTAEQMNKAQQFVTEQTIVFQAASKPATKPAAGAKRAPEPPSAELRSLTLYCQALLCGNGFLYVD